MSTCVEIPVLNGPLDAPTIIAWLNTCEDAFEAWQAFHPDKTLSLSMQILLAGLKLKETNAKLWWSKEHVKLKALECWSEFTAPPGNLFYYGSSTIA